MLLVIMLVLGGSVGYEAERNSQTASDAAALAATSTLRRIQTSSPSDVTDFNPVLATARDVAEANGADAGASVSCVLIKFDQTPIDDCGSADFAEFVAASGVAVGADDTRDVPFGEVAGQAKITGSTTAAATAQKLANGTSPFMVCDAAYDDEGDPRDILEPVTTTADPNDYTIKASAKGQLYVLQGNPVKSEGRDCGHPASSFRGWVKFESTYPLPGDWAMEEGNKNGHIERQLVGPDACGGQNVDVEDFNGCIISVPLCVSGSGGSSDYKLYCVAMATFKIVWNGNGPSEVPADPDPETGGPAGTCSEDNQKHICGRFIGASIATGGQGAEGPVGVNETAVIKLVK